MLFTPRNDYEACTLPEIQVVTSSSTHATTLGAIRWCFGNSPRRSKRQIVERDNPVLSRTTGNLNSLRGRTRGPEDACAVGAVAGRGAAVGLSPTRLRERTRTPPLGLVRK